MKQLKNQNGFSLVEIVVAMVLFAFALQGLAFMSLFTIKANHLSMEKTRATTLAQEKIEHVKAVEFEEIEYVQGTEEYSQIPGYESYKRITTIEDSPGEPDVKIVLAQIVVRNFLEVADQRSHLLNGFGRDFRGAQGACVSEFMEVEKSAYLANDPVFL